MAPQEVGAGSLALVWRRAGAPPCYQALEDPALSRENALPRLLDGAGHGGMAMAIVERPHNHVFLVGT
jgi:hypothetical protein